MKALAALALVLAAACGGRELVPSCDGVTDDAGHRAQMCSPPGAMPFCCPADAVCGTGDLPSGNGCPIGSCCPSPDADGGAS